MSPIQELAGAMLRYPLAALGAADSWMLAARYQFATFFFNVTTRRGGLGKD